MRLFLSIIVITFSIQAYSNSIGTREGDLDYARSIRASDVTDRSCQVKDSTGQRIYAFRDAAAVIRCATIQDIQRANNCRSNPKYNSPIWIGSEDNPVIRCAYVDPNTFEYYFNVYEDTPNKKANCPTGFQMNPYGKCEKTEKVGLRGGSGSAGGAQQPGNTYQCSVGGRILNLEVSQQDCEEIKSAYRKTTTTPGHEFALGVNIADLEQPVLNCQKHQESAQICCGDPYSCLGGSPGENQALSILGGLLQGGNKMIAGGTASITSACETLKNIGRSASAIQAGMSQKCNQYATQCQENCRPYQETLNAMNDYFSTQGVCDLTAAVTDQQLTQLLNQSASTYKNNCTYKQKVSSMKQSITSTLVSCNTSKQQVGKILQDAVGTQSIAEFANKCQEQSSNQNTFAQDSSAPFNGDCTNPAHASNPICVQCRLDPGAQQCVGINTGMSPTQANSNKPGIFEDNDRNDDLMGYNSLGTSNASDENPGLGDPQSMGPDGNRGLAASGTGGGSGGGLGQDNIQALGTDPGAQAKAGGDGYNTNILGNATGGGGYTVSSMGYGSGGGYSNRITTDIYENTPPTGIIKDGFDLKEYLPGGKAFKRKSRLPAGYIQLPDGEVIGPKHGNIFHMMHERYAYYESLGKFWPPHYSKEKIECIKKSGILNHPPYSNQWSGDNLHKPTPIPDPPQCRHFADHDPNKPDPTMIYLKAEAKKEMLSRSPQSVVASFKGKSLHEIYHALTAKRSELSKPQYEALLKHYNYQRKEFRKKYGK